MNGISIIILIIFTIALTATTTASQHHFHLHHHHHHQPIKGIYSLIFFSLLFYFRFLITFLFHSCSLSFSLSLPLSLSPFQPFLNLRFGREKRKKEIGKNSRPKSEHQPSVSFSLSSLFLMKVLKKREREKSNRVISESPF